MTGHHLLSPSSLGSRPRAPGPVFQQKASNQKVSQLKVRWVPFQRARGGFAPTSGMKHTHGQVIIKAGSNRTGVLLTGVDTAGNTGVAEGCCGAHRWKQRDLPCRLNSESSLASWRLPGSQSKSGEHSPELQLWGVFEDRKTHPGGLDQYQASKQKYRGQKHAGYSRMSRPISITYLFQRNSSCSKQPSELTYNHTCYVISSGKF